MQLFGIDIDNISFKSLTKDITQLSDQRIIFTPNPEILLKTLEDTEFKKLLNKAHYLTSDGIGLYIGYQIVDNNYGKLCNFLLLPYYVFNLFFRRDMLYEKYGERICGSDLTDYLVNYAQDNNIPITIIDLYNPTDEGKVASQKLFSAKLQAVFPNLNFDYIIYNPDKKDEIIEKIKKSDSKMLFSTLGMKRQEKSVIEVMKEAKNIKVGLGIGSSFDYFIGFQKRAPEIWRKIGLEWLYRLFTGPRKLQRLSRLYKAVIVFPITVIMRSK